MAKATKLPLSDKSRPLDRSGNFNITKLMPSPLLVLTENKGLGSAYLYLLLKIYVPYRGFVKRPKGLSDKKDHV